MDFLNPLMAIVWYRHALLAIAQMDVNLVDPIKSVIPVRMKITSFLIRSASLSVQLAISLSTLVERRIRNVLHVWKTVKNAAILISVKNAKIATIGINLT